MLIQRSWFFLSGDRLVLKICKENSAFNFWQKNVGFEKQGGEDHQVVHWDLTNLFELVYVCPPSAHLKSKGFSKHK